MAFKHSTPSQVRRMGYEVGGICDECDGITDTNGYCVDCGRIVRRCDCPGTRNAKYQAAVRARSAARKKTLRNAAKKQGRKVNKRRAESGGFWRGL